MLVSFCSSFCSIRFCIFHLNLLTNFNLQMGPFSCVHFYITAYCTKNDNNNKDLQRREHGTRFYETTNFEYIG